MCDVADGHRLSESVYVEAAYRILKARGEPMPLRELIEKAVQELQVETQPTARLMARIHTAVNLDPRFQYIRGGLWSLREWAPPEAPFRQPRDDEAVRVGARTVSYDLDWEDEELNSGASEDEDEDQALDEYMEEWEPTCW